MSDAIHIKWRSPSAGRAEHTYSSHTEHVKQEMAIKDCCPSDNSGLSTYINTRNAHANLSSQYQHHKCETKVRRDNNINVDRNINFMGQCGLDSTCSGQETGILNTVMTLRVPNKCKFYELRKLLLSASEECSCSQLRPNPEHDTVYPNCSLCSSQSLQENTGAVP
jgi:hypothetical protein